MLEDFSERFDPFQIEVALMFFGRVAAQAILFEQRTDFPPVFIRLRSASHNRDDNYPNDSAYRAANGGCELPALVNVACRIANALQGLFAVDNPAIHALGKSASKLAQGQFPHSSNHMLAESLP